ncbi:MAG: class I SAM-dependent methyltransferase [Hydrogenophilaceae bacterium]|jgi:cyclopropane-fatty-acyl-phospholipid synthase|nr:class I SAM-dependent methyltransferase [Hydrogenophilaceae bacterium]
MALDAPASLKAVCFALLDLKAACVRLRFADGRALQFGEPGGPEAELIIRNPRFARRVLLSGDIGFAEGFMAGEWDTPDLSALLTVLSANGDRIARMIKGNLLVRAVNLVRHAGRRNTRAGARKNIHEHYDLGNRFYSAWLDPTMTYSSARFDAPGQALKDAQLAKYRALAAHLELKPGERVLEIGCGWGGFAEIAAREYGAEVVGVTISEAQKKFADERMAAAGLSDRVEIRLQDYRDVRGAFDKVASIEMFEAVGERYWPAYFAKISDVLRPGGAAALQIITIRDDLFSAYRRRADFIQRYIFPGGMLPSVSRLEAETERAGLVWRKLEAFGQSYADTLAQWSQSFTAKWDEIRSLGFDERFKQLWRFYLSYCEAGFRTGRTDVVQLSLAKPA